MRDWRAELRSRLSAASGSGDPADIEDVIEELAEHMEEQNRDLVARGKSEVEADAVLLAGFDDTQFGSEIMAGRRHVAPRQQVIGAPAVARTWWGGVYNDLVYAARGLLRAPTFAIVAIVSLGLAIGSTTAVFGLVHAIFIERLAIPRAGELVAIRPVAKTSGPQPAATRGRNVPLGYADYQLLKQAPGLGDMEAHVSQPVEVSVRGVADVARVDLVSGGFFKMIGVAPLRGRLLSDADEQTRAPVAVISEAYWRRQMSADPSVLGETITVGGIPFGIVGIMPRAYRGIYFGQQFNIAVPISVAEQIGLPDPNTWPVTVIGRMGDGANGARASAVADTAFQRCCADGWHVHAVDASRGLPWASDARVEYRRVLQLLAGGVLILLLIACANVGNLLLTRALARNQELAVRISLGASRSRIVRQLLVESALLAAIGTALGLVLARGGTMLLAHNLPAANAGLAELIPLHPSAGIMAFIVAVMVMCTVLIGILPALRATRPELTASLSGRLRRVPGSAWLTTDRAVVVGQVALALMLVSAAGLLASTLGALRENDGGYGSNNVLFASLDTYMSSSEAGELMLRYPEVLSSVRAVRGVESAAMAFTSPVFGRSRMAGPSRVVGSGLEKPVGTDINFVSTEYFSATGIPLLRGREFTQADMRGVDPVAIISESMVRNAFGGRDPIGATLMIGTRPERPLRVVGVVGNVKYMDLREEPRDLYYTPMPQPDFRVGRRGVRQLDVVIRTTGEPGAIASDVRRAIEAAAPGIRVTRVQTLDDALNQLLPRERLAAALASVFGLLALVLAAIGLYGVLAYNVARRTREIGVRTALGAQAADTVWLVLRQTAVMVCIGVVIGAPLALAAARGISAQLYGVAPTDIRVLAGAAVSLAVVGVFASLLPAARATHVDPAIALRSE